MKVSVIVPAYNMGKYIKRCLLSLVNQTLSDIEIIVVNDGSTDNTLENIIEVQNQYNIVKVINQNNMGAIEARKSGLSIAKGEYILFVDGDDWIELNTLELLYNNAKINDSDIVIYDVFLVYSDRKHKFSDVNGIISEDYLKNLFLGKIQNWTVTKFLKLDFIRDNNVIFPKDMSYGEDLATVASLFMNNPKVSIFKENLYNYYRRNDSISSMLSPKVLELNNAFSFIKDQMLKNNIYLKYKEEFEYSIYSQLFLLGIIRGYFDDEVIGPELHKQYKAWGIKNNNIIRKSLRNVPTRVKIRIKCYDKSYKCGKVCDKVIYKITKLIYKIKGTDM